MKVIAILISIIVLSGVLYGFFSPESEINQQLQRSPWYMKSLGAIVFVIGGAATYFLATGKIGVGQDDTKSWIPVVATIIITLLLSFFLATNFYNEAH